MFSEIGIELPLVMQWFMILTWGIAKYWFVMAVPVIVFLIYQSFRFRSLWRRVISRFSPWRWLHRPLSKNNLAQIGLASHNYEYAHEHFPAGVIDAKGPILSVPQGKHVGFLVQLLPFIEQRGIADNFDIEAVTPFSLVNALTTPP